MFSKLLCLNKRRMTRAIQFWAIVFSTNFISCALLYRPYFETHENNEDGTKQNRMERNTRQNENRCLHTIRRRDFCFNDPKFTDMYIRCWLIIFFSLHFVIVIFESFSLSRHKFSQKNFGLLVLGYFDIVAEFSLYSTRHSIEIKMRRSVCLTDSRIDKRQ